MIKVIGLLKRRADMTTEQFRRYYETHHRRLGERLLAGYAAHYERRYLDAQSSEGASAGDFDVLLEVWYADAATHAAASAYLASPEVAAEIAEDEERLFDRPQNRFFVVAEEVVSTL